MITPKSSGADWLAASPDAQRKYVNGACRGCVAVGNGASSPDLVIEGISAYFAVPGSEAHSVSLAFGQIHGALVGFGDHRPLVEKNAEAARTDAAMNTPDTQRNRSSEGRSEILSRVEHITKCESVEELNDLLSQGGHVVLGLLFEGNWSKQEIYVTHLVGRLRGEAPECKSANP